MWVGGGGVGSQRLLSLNPTTVLVVLLLELWLLLGCDNAKIWFNRLIITFLLNQLSSNARKDTLNSSIKINPSIRDF